MHRTEGRVVVVASPNNESEMQMEMYTIVYVQFLSVNKSIQLRLITLDKA